ncbi:MAG: polysaccharide deacetylase family protein [Chthoniobacteraceae bacterium]
MNPAQNQSATGLLWQRPSSDELDVSVKEQQDRAHGDTKRLCRLAAPVARQPIPGRQPFRLVLTLILLLTGALAPYHAAVEIRQATPVEMICGPSGKQQVALTFDLGAEVGSLSEVLEALNAARVRVTFFITGEWATQHPAWVRRISREGHEIGNHTWSHPDLTTQPDTAIAHELQKTDALITSLTGRSTRPLWRAPFGARDSRVLRAAARAGFLSVYWSIDSLDAVGQPKSSRFLLERIVRSTHTELDGAIILMHAGEMTTGASVGPIIRELYRRGFRVVTVSEMRAGRTARRP